MSVLITMFQTLQLASVTLGRPRHFSLFNLTQTLNPVLHISARHRHSAQNRFFNLPQTPNSSQALHLVTGTSSRSKHFRLFNLTKSLNLVQNISAQTRFFNLSQIPNLVQDPLARPRHLSTPQIFQSSETFQLNYEYRLSGYLAL